MKKQLLIIFALMAITMSGHAMQRARSFDYNTHKYNLPADAIKNFKVGETFTITNADPRVLSPRYLKDATGKNWAENTASVYPYSGTTTPGKGTLTFTVRAIPSVIDPSLRTATFTTIPKSVPQVATITPAAKPIPVPAPTDIAQKGYVLFKETPEHVYKIPDSGIITVKPTKEEIIATLQALIKAIQANDIPAAGKHVKKMYASQGLSDQDKKFVEASGEIENLKRAVEAASPETQRALDKLAEQQ